MSGTGGTVHGIGQVIASLIIRPSIKNFLTFPCQLIILTSNYSDNY